MDSFGRDFECLYGCDLSCIAFTEIIAATSMLALRLRGCSALGMSADSLLGWCCMENHRKRLPGCQTSLFSPSSEVSEVPVFSLLSLWLFICYWTTSHLCAVFLWVIHAVLYHSYVGNDAQFAAAATRQPQSAAFLMVTQLPDVATETFMLSVVWLTALMSGIHCVFGAVEQTKIMDEVDFR